MDFFFELIQNGILPGIFGIVVFFLIIIILKIFIRVSLPEKIVVINGRGKMKGDKKFGFSVERGRVNVVPYFEEIQYLDLSVLPINVRVEGVNSANGITIGADATACVCINDEDESMLYAAVEKLMGKSRSGIHEQIQQTLIGNFRGALNKATPLQAIGMEDVKGENDNENESDRAQFRNELFKDINNDLSNFGMKVVSVSLQKIWDTSNYIANLAQKMLAQKRQEVEIEESRLKANADQIESDAKRRISVATNKTEERIIQAKQKYEMFSKESEASIQKAVLEANNEIEGAKNKGQKEIEEKNIELNKLKNASKLILEADARQKAAEIIASGENESVKIREEVKNSILRQKIDILEKAGDVGKMLLFAKKLHFVYDSYKKYAESINVDSYVIMDDKKGFNGGVNRGPAAFVDFMKYFEEGLGINIRDLLDTGKSTPVKGGKS
jgi:flotillin